MRAKDTSVQCEFHPILTAFLFRCDTVYREWDSELTITSGSETGTRHGYTSLHYATPAQAADIRSWAISLTAGGLVSAQKQHTALQDEAQKYCISLNIPHDWIEVILESNHIHVEYQPKRLAEV